MVDTIGQNQQLNLVRELEISTIFKIKPNAGVYEHVKSHHEDLE